MAKVKCGARIRHASMPDNVGTLGCIVESAEAPGVRYLLTAAHVIGKGGYARKGDPIEAWTPDDGGWTKIAEFERAVRLHDAPGAVQTCDAAIARILDPTKVSDEVLDIGRIEGISSRAWPGMELQFAGAGTGGVARARVESTGNPVPVIYEDYEDGGTFTLQLDNQVLYGLQPGSGWTSATQPGDSGALVLDAQRNAVGLHVGRTPVEYPVQASVCTPLQVVLDALRVRLPVPAAAVPAAPVSPVVAATAAVGVPGTGDDAADDRFGEESFARFGISMRTQLVDHNLFGGQKWRLGPDGLVVAGALPRTGGKLVTVPRVWREFGTLITAAAARHAVPVELILATVCTESGGNPSAVRIEPGWTSDSATPGRVSVGLMQTLISTARSATGNLALTRQSLLDPEVSILAGTAYIDQQRMQTRLDAPVVACAYNAGGAYLQEGSANAWRMRQYPIGTGHHADRFVQWFNDAFAFFTQDPTLLGAGTPSLWRLFRS